MLSQYSIIINFYRSFIIVRWFCFSESSNVLKENFSEKNMTPHRVADWNYPMKCLHKESFRGLRLQPDKWLTCDKQITLTFPTTTLKQEIKLWLAYDKFTHRKRTETFAVPAKLQIARQISKMLKEQKQ